MSEMPVSNWKSLSGKGWPQLQETTWLALEVLEQIAASGDPRAGRALDSMRRILRDGSFDPATRPTGEPPDELRWLAEAAVSERRA